MLKSLSIQNFALIKDVAIEFQNGLSMITGETGAGKSILLGALSLIMGKRADLNVIRDKQSKCTVEAYLLLDKDRFRDFFERMDLDLEEDTIIRREILPSGKSRAFVNDTPVRLSMLNQLTENLIDIHSQHQTLDLNDEDYQYDLIDTIADANNILQEYRSRYKELGQLKKKIRSLEKSKQEAQKNLDYNDFLLKELKEIALENIDLEQLENQQVQLSNVNLIKEELAKVHQILENEEFGVLEQLNESYRSLNKVAEFSKEMTEFAERLNSSIIELQDLDQSIQLQADQLEDNPMELEKIDQKLQVVYRLMDKHQAEDISELVQIRNELEEKVFSDANIDQEIKKLKEKIQIKEEKCFKIADKLLEKRTSAASKIKEHVENKLALLGMKEAIFQIELAKVNELGKYGRDKMSWKFSANKGAEIRPISKVASGGELSRISLSLKNLMARNSDLPTLIFDEIDTGVSGEIANKMGMIMQEMGENMQLICITHLPQIAAKGKFHYKVFKYTKDEATYSDIKELDDEGRMNEITNMLGGDKESKAARSHARTLFNN